MAKARLVLADDHSIVLEAYKQLLEPEYDVVGTASNGQELLEIAPALSPDVILLDISMPTMNGLDVTRQLRTAVPHAKLIFVTMMSEPFYISQAFDMGASGYVLKQSASTELLSALAAALKNQRYISPQLSLEVQDAIETPWVKPEGFSSKLTPRQQEVLQLLTKGCSTKEIASTLNVSTKAVEFHKGNITRRLGIRTTAELTRFALSQGLTTLDEQHP
ncbi:response regulator transcription factor [Nitrospirales bacterium NOB]|nr:MAG: LuxR family response regulator [Nitrospira sp. OLB3]MBV6469533.1 Transcriptional regulatory protein DegU [Nitrospirota bacterium]MCE7965329.1 DNA-binding response regulator [Nitrospira sp. NTP2]MCK6493452.1 response regulator transcription factor [Nitrospira sp.]MDL1888374.1 response regulator transcription factor [Nitrospirales bacterium NOB]MEB2338902.1 response regulator transcription factor [Nitrospirales bacterium]